MHQYALIDSENRVHCVAVLEDSDRWQYPEGFTLVEADDYEFDYTREYADYIYTGDGFELQPQGVEVSTIDDVIAAKVDEALANAEKRINTMAATRMNSSAI